MMLDLFRIFCYLKKVYLLLILNFGLSPHLQFVFKWLQPGQAEHMKGLQRDANAMCSKAFGKAWAVIECIFVMVDPQLVPVSTKLQIL